MAGASIAAVVDVILIESFYRIIVHIEEASIWRQMLRSVK
jgi:hypothetical protein